MARGVIIEGKKKLYGLTFAFYMSHFGRNQDLRLGENITSASMAFKRMKERIGVNENTIRLWRDSYDNINSVAPRQGWKDTANLTRELQMVYDKLSEDPETVRLLSAYFTKYLNLGDETGLKDYLTEKRLTQEFPEPY